MPVRGPVPQSSKSSKDVNNLLHTLRGEHFRRTLNTQHTSRLGTTHLTPQLVGRSLPYAEIYGLQPDRSSSRALGVDAKVTRTTAAGPIPRSWAAASTAPPAAKVSESTWRATALSLFFYYAQNGSDYTSSHWHLTSLAKCCLRVLLEHCHDCHCAAADADADADDGGVTTSLEELASFLAPHHRREAVRMCAVWRPLSGARLRALLGEGRNHVEGELVVVQPASPLRPEMFFRAQKTQTQTQTYAIQVNDRQRQRQHQHAESGSEEPSSWQQWDDDRDAEADDSEADHSGRSTVTVTDAGSDWQEQEQEDLDEQVFTAVAIVSTTLSIPVLLALPSSLTRLALVHLSAPIPIHRLPDKCPLLELLDISYNPWLAEPAWGVERALERVEWGRWAYLKVLGCRDCGVTLEELRTVNEGRWEDVSIVT